MFRMRGLFTLAVLILTAAACGHDKVAARDQAMDRARQYVSQKKQAEAIIEFRKAVAEDPGFGPARFELGRAYEGIGDIGNAFQEYVRAADLMPNDIPAQLTAGQMLLAARQYPEAKARGEAVLKLDPKSSDGLLLFGNALAGLKDFAGAVTQVEEAIDKEPQRTLLYANLGLMQMASGDKAAAESAFKRAVDVAPGDASAHAGLANFYWSAGRRNEAEAELKQALTLKPGDPALLQAMASFYIEAGRLTEAESYLKAYSEAARDPGSQVTLADFYLTLGKPTAAVSALTPVSQGSTAFALPATLRLAAIDYESGEREKAHQTVDGVLEREPKNELANLAKSRFLLREAKFADALALTGAVVSANPRSLAGLFLKGMALKGTGDIDSSITAFQEVMKLNPTLYNAQVLLADLYVSKGDGDAAAEYASAAIKERPASGSAHLAMAKALVLQGKLPAAEAELAALRKTNPDFPELHRISGDLAWQKRDLARARAEYARALALDSSSNLALTGLIQADLAEKKIAAARDRVEAKLASGSTDPEFFVVAGVTYIAAGDAKKAESAFRRALELDPTNLDGYGRLGALYMMTNRVDAAKAEYERMLNGKPDAVVLARTMLGTIYGLQGKPDEAGKQYEQALATDPEAAVAANNLAWHYAASDGPNLDIALKLAQTAKRKLPKSWEATDTLGWIYYKKGLSDLAVTTLREAVKQNPSNATLHYHLGLAYMKGGSKRDAQQSLEQALKLDPKFPEAEEARRALASVKG